MIKLYKVCLRYSYALSDITDGFQIIEATEILINSDEYFFNPGWFSEKAVNMFEWTFTSRKFKSASFFTDNRIIGGFFAEINPMQVIRHRSIYNFLDYMGDVGGLYWAFSRIGSVFLYFFGIRSLQGYLVSSIFSVESAEERV